MCKHEIQNFYFTLFSSTLTATTQIIESYKYEIIQMENIEMIIKIYQ
jgi:hypothetical protein